MKISELPHRDPAWAYIELNDGSLVAMPKKAVEELEAENSQLKKDLEHARSYKHTIKMRNRNLHTENERLKEENAKLKCLSLHAMKMYFLLRSSQCVDVDNLGQALRLMNVAVKYDKAYRKAKKELQRKIANRDF